MDSNIKRDCDCDSDCNHDCNVGVMGQIYANANANANASALFGRSNVITARHADVKDRLRGTDTKHRP